MSYDELGNERRKAVCELRNMQMDTGNAIKKLAVALGLEWNPNNAPKSVALLQNRIIHLLGGDEPNFTEIAKTINLGDKSDGELMENGENHKIAAITDELREFATDPLLGYASQELHVERITAIADRIDEQFDRISQQQETVLQATIDSMCEEQDRLQERLRAAELGCDANHRLAEANVRWCDELVDLLRDAAREYEDMRMERDDACAERDNLLVLLRYATVDFKNASYGSEYAIIVGKNITIETERNRLAKERDNLLDLLRDATKEYKMLDQMSTETSANFHAMRDRVWGLEAERDELQSTIDEMAAELDSARAKNRRLTWHIDQMQGGSRKWREKCEALTVERDELQEKNDELQEKNRHLAQKCDTMLVFLSNRAMDAKSDQEQRIEKLVRQRDELRVKLKEIGDIVND